MFASISLWKDLLRISVKFRPNEMNDNEEEGDQVSTHVVSGRPCGRSLRDTFQIGSGISLCLLEFLGRFS